MFSRWVRTWDSKILKPPLLLLAHCGITPNMLTAAGVITTAGSGFLVGFGYLGTGALVLLLGAFLDGIDGEMARLLKRDTRMGAFLDSVADHFGDLAVHIGLIYYYLTGGFQTEMILVFLALFGSMLGSQIRSRAGMILGIDTANIGFFTRFERLLVLMLGLAMHQVTIALWILVLFNNFSAMQRLIYVIRIVHLSGRETLPV